MGRTFSRNIEPREVDVLDWELIDRISEAFGEYVDEPGELSFTATDSRGGYAEGDLDSFKAAVKEQEQPPASISIVLSTPRVYALVCWGSERGGRAAGEDEAAVVHLHDRCTSLLGQAAARRETRLAAAETQTHLEVARHGNPYGPRETSLPPRVSLPTARAQSPHHGGSFIRDVSVHVVGAVLAIVLVAAGLAIWALLTH